MPQANLKTVLIIVPSIIQKEHALLLVLHVQPALNRPHKPARVLRHFPITTGNRFQLSVIETFDLKKVTVKSI
jgi:hypothetical protein